MITSTNPRWPLAEAQATAERLRTLLAPACERIVIAGSIRRQASTIGDVELVVIPKIFHDSQGIPQSWESWDHLHGRVIDLFHRGFLGFRHNKKGVRQYGPKNKYLTDTATGMGLDIFSTTVENWGMTVLVRTGPAEFVRRAMARFRQLRMSGHAYGGVTDAEGVRHDCPDEETVFRLLGWDYLPPERRQ